MHPKALSHLEHTQGQTKLVLRAAAERVQHAAPAQSDEICFLCLSDCWSELDPQLIGYLSDLTITSVLVSFRQVFSYRKCMNHVLLLPSLRPRHFGEFNLSHLTNE